MARSLVWSSNDLQSLQHWLNKRKLNTATLILLELRERLPLTPQILGELFGDRWVVVKSDNRLFSAFPCLKMHLEGEVPRRELCATAGGQRTYLDYERSAFSVLLSPRWFSPQPGYSETWVFWGNPSSAQLCSEFDEETLEFTAVGSAFMLALLKCTPLHSLVTKNLVLLDVKKSVYAGSHGIRLSSSVCSLSWMSEAFC